MKPRLFGALTLLFAHVAAQHPAAAIGNRLVGEEGELPPRCWVVNASLKRIGSDLPTPAASYTLNGRCEVDYSTNRGKWGPKGIINESTFDKVKVIAVIEWTAEGTYQPLQKNTWEEITLRETYVDRPGFMAVGTLTGWMTCAKDPWREPDGFPCGSPGYKTAGTVDGGWVRLYERNLSVPQTSHLSSQQRAALNSAYQAAIQKAQAAIKKAKLAVPVVSVGKPHASDARYVVGTPTPAPPPQYPKYGAAYSPTAVPGSLTVNQTIYVPVTVRNLSSQTWPKGGAFRLAYHWYRGVEKIVHDGARTFMPAAVAPGATVTLNAKVIAPTSEGASALRWDMVQEGVIHTWFSEQNVEMSTPQNLTVTP